MSTTSTQNTTQTRTHSVILRLGDRFCSVPVDNVREMTVMPEVEPLCGVPPFVRGLCKLRGGAIPVVDLRARLGMSPLSASNHDLMATLKLHEKDQLNWVKELEASVVEGRDFNLGTDPNTCEFALWLVSFEPATRELSHLLHSFDAPHAAMLGVAKAVKVKVRQGLKEEALQIIERTRSTDLTFMIEQFQRVYAHLVKPAREIVAVLEVEGEIVGVAVDEVESLAWVQPQSGDISIETASLDSVYSSIGKVEETGLMVTMLDPSTLRILT